MTATLHLAPLGRGKTEHTLTLLREVAAARADLPSIWVLLATRRQELAFRQRLMSGDYALPVYCNIRFFNFYSLNAHLLQRAGKPARRLSKLARFGALRHLTRQMSQAGQLSYFQRIAETRGFVAIIADLIDELKQSRVDVDKFAAAALSAKDRDIAAIYRRYQALLRESDLVDVEGEGWLALAMLGPQAGITADVDLLVVDGYDQFTPVQAQTLAALGQGVRQLHITLTAPPDSGWQSSTSRSRLARNRLEHAFADAGAGLEVKPIAARGRTRHADLERLALNLFDGAAFAGASNAIRLIAMPDPAEEVKAVLRAVKRQLLDGVPPDDILIALRDWERYAAQVEAGRRAYDLPLLLHNQPAYASTPVIAALIDLLNLAPRFRRRELLDALRSPYFDCGLDAEAIHLLARVSHEQQLLGGAKADWLEIIKLARAPADSPAAAEQLTRLTAAQAENLERGLSDFFAGVTPPPRAELPQYVAWLLPLLGGDPRAPSDDPEEAGDEAAYSLNVFHCAWQQKGADADIVRRDLSALDGLRTILRDLLASDDVLAAGLENPATIDWTQFRADLIHALETTAEGAYSAPRNGQVLVTTAAEARGLPHAHVYIPGLSEGVFPAEAQEDPLYLDSEREAMQARGIPLATWSERVDDQGLFIELVSLAGRTLTLSQPLYQAGKPWQPSQFWRAVERVFPSLEAESRPAGATVAPEQAANPTELMLAVSAGLSQRDGARREQALAARDWLRTRPDYDRAWQRIKRGRRVERGRLSNAPFDKFSGLLSRPILLDEAARQLGDDRVWSATQLNEYGACGFRFFAKRLLQLEEVSEPEAGAGPIQQGALAHKILEDAYRKIRSRGLEIEAGSQDEALDILAAVAEDILPRAPARFGFRENATWPEEMQLHFNRLKQLVKDDFSSDSPLSSFGQPRSVWRQEAFYEDLPIRLAAGMKPLRVNARIDRIDVADGGLVVVDYKSGGRPINRREMEIGRDFQMMIYMLVLISEFEAMEADEEVAGGLFWHIRNRKASGVFCSENEDDLAAVEAARAHIARNLQQGRAGQFPVQPTALDQGKCVRYCEFSHLCRLNVTRRYKALPPVATPAES